MLGKKAILDVLQSGDLKISDYSNHDISINSIDMRIGDKVGMYIPKIACNSPSSRSMSKVVASVVKHSSEYLDSRVKPSAYSVYQMDSSGWLLVPNCIYLMYTYSSVTLSEKLVAKITGKSSGGRLGISVHETAGLIDSGFSGQITLEVSCQQPVYIYPYQYLTQLELYYVNGADAAYIYNGRYKGINAEGPVPSRAWEQFIEDKARHNLEK